MKLYYARGACSLSNRIALHEAGIAFAEERVDLGSRMTESGRDFRELNPKGYVPLLVLDDGAAVTENVAVLSLIAERAPNLLPDGDLGRVRLLEALSFISSELHVAFKPLFHDSGEPEREIARSRLADLLNVLTGDMADDYLLGGHFTVADAYLFVILLWARKFEVVVTPGLAGYFRRIEARPRVRTRPTACSRRPHDDGAAPRSATWARNSSACNAGAQLRARLSPALQPKALLCSAPKTVSLSASSVLIGSTISSMTCDRDFAITEASASSAASRQPRPGPDHGVAFGPWSCGGASPSRVPLHTQSVATPMGPIP
jgi:glutathione S-transferase